MNRIYSVTNGENARLVRATNRAQALAHVARTTFACGVASQDELVDLLASGVEVETAGVTAIEEPTE
jgi:hypothetical protein